MLKSNSNNTNLDNAINNVLGRITGHGDSMKALTFTTKDRRSFFVVSRFVFANADGTSKISYDIPDFREIQLPETLRFKAIADKDGVLNRKTSTGNEFELQKAYVPLVDMI